ncbi:MAG: hypothetical protein H0X24_14850 [Ktedonobacterales bacterium]|nr:hypothetical protein [Ktedonobacterales bacterium]
MASQSEPPPPSAEIIEFVPRQLVRRDVYNLISASTAEFPMPQVRRMIADACTRYGPAVVRELGRIVTHGPNPTALAAIRILLIIADEPAQVTLWRVARDEGRNPAQRLEALRGLYQQGHEVTLAELVEMATLAERRTPPREREAP